MSKQEIRNLVQLKALSERIDEFLRDYNPVEYADTECNKAYVLATLIREPYTVIGYLLDIAIEFADRANDADGYIATINKALDLSKQVYTRI